MSAVDILDAGAVARYHTVPCSSHQSVADHSWGVAQILRMIEPTCSKAALCAALDHDVAERWTGDVPATAKWNDEALKAALDAHEARIEKWLGIDRDLVDGEWAALKVADMLELVYHSGRMLRAGNRHYLGPYDRGIDWLIKSNLMNYEAKALLARFIKENNGE